MRQSQDLPLPYVRLRSTLIQARRSRRGDIGKGERRSFDLVLDLGELPPFRRRVLEELAGIPYGETVSYGDLADALAALPADADAETIQTEVYEVGKRHACFASLRDWFRALYQILLGQDEGPRMGSFFALYGLNESIDLIRRSAAGGADVSGRS